MAERSEAGDENTLIVETAIAVNSIVSLQQSACSALARGFGLCFTTGSHFYELALFRSYTTFMNTAYVFLAVFFLFFFKIYIYQSVFFFYYHLYH